MTAAQARLLVRALVSARFRFNRGAGLIEVTCPDGQNLIVELDANGDPMLDKWQEETIRGHLE